MRFYQHGENAYLSQFAQLPLDWMYENIKSQQAERDATLAGIEAQTYPVEYLTQGLRGYEQSQAQFAKQVMDEYDQKNNKVVDMILQDPRSSRRAAAELGKLNNEFINDQRVIQLKQNKLLYEESQKQMAEAMKKGYAADVYQKYQNLYTFNPATETGEIAPFIPDTEFALKQDVPKLAMELTKDIAKDGTAYAGLSYWGGIGVQNASGKTVGIDRDKVEAVAQNLISPFINSTEGQYWLDDLVNKRYPGLRTGYHVNMEELRNIEVPDTYIEEKDAKGKVISKRNMTAADVVEADAATYLFNIASKQIGTVRERHVGFSGISEAAMNKVDNAGRVIYDVSSAISPTQVGKGENIGVNIEGLWKVDDKTGSVESDMSFWDKTWNAAKAYGVGLLTNLFVPGAGLAGGVISTAGVFDSKSILEPVENALGIDLTSNSSTSATITPQQFNQFKYLITSTAKNKTDFNNIMSGLTIKVNDASGYDIGMTEDAQNRTMTNISDDYNQLRTMRTERDDKEWKFLNSNYFVQDPSKKDSYILNDAARSTMLFYTPNLQVINATQLAEGMGLKEGEMDNLAIVYNGRGRNASTYGDANLFTVTNKKTGEKMEVASPAYQNNVRYNDGTDAQNVATYYNNEFGKNSLTANKYFAIPIDNRNATEYYASVGTLIPQTDIMNSTIAGYVHPIGAVRRDNGTIDVVYYNAQNPDNSKVIASYKDTKEMQDKANAGILGKEIFIAIGNSNK